jgi:phosphatidylinositol alpha-1,6-mannosyltransferase
VTAVAREHRCSAVWFGAAAPLALLAPALRRAGAERIVATTHGHEAGWAMLPGARQVLRHIGGTCDVVTYLSEYFSRRLAPAFGPRATLRRLTPGVDVETFHPGVDGSAVRARHGLTGRPVVVCVSRLVPRKGQDALIRALPAIRRTVPGAVLLLVGRGRYRDELARLARRSGVADHVVFTGGVPAGELAAHYAAGDVFAMPCRTRRGGMDVEGLGIVYLEASALGLPVVVGDSGGAPEALRDGETGYLVDGRDVTAIADRTAELLDDAPLRAKFGEAGRQWVQAEWRWDAVAAQLRALLDG